MAQSRLTITAQADPNGNAVPKETIGPRGSISWQVSQITVTSTSSAQSLCAVAVNGHAVCATSSGNSDTADGPPTIKLSSRDQLEIVWSQCTPGASCTAVIFYESS